MTLPIDRTNKSALDTNLVNGNTSDAPKVKANNDTVYNTIDELYNYAAGLVQSNKLSDMGIINVKDTAKGDGVTDDYAAINSLITSIGSNKGTLAIANGTFKLSSNITFPSNITILFLQGGMISPDNGKTVTINGSIVAGLYQIFTGLGTIAGSPDVREYYPQWWGAKGDGVNDDSPPINAALTCANGAGGCTVFLPPGKYLINSVIQMQYDGVHLCGAGYGESPQVCTELEKNFNGNAIEIKDPAGGQTLHWSLSNLNINGNSKTGDGIYASAAHYGRIQNVYVYNNTSGHGIYFDLSFSNIVENCQSVGNSINFRLDNQSHDTTFINTRSSTAGLYGYQVSNCNAVRMFGVNHEGAASYGFYLYRNCKDIVIDGFYVECSNTQLTNYAFFVSEPTTASLAMKNISIRNGYIRINSGFKAPIILRSFVYGATIENVNIEFNGFAVDSNVYGVLVGWSAGENEVVGIRLVNVHVDLVGTTGSGVSVGIYQGNAKHCQGIGCTSSDTTALIQGTYDQDMFSGQLVRGRYSGRRTHYNFIANTAEPDTNTTTVGTLAYANGSNWNPANMSAGFHYRNPSGTWVRLVEALTGTTAQRPTTENFDGRPYFDTSLGKPIWRKASAGTGWVDATGTSV